LLLEHFVLNEIYAHLQTKRKLYYWRDKREHEVDFILLPQKGNPLAIETKWKAEGFDPKNILAFRKRYPKGENFVVCFDVERGFSRRYNNLKVNFLNLPALIKEIV
jgi:predicted AAA+ superfamily ATPase